MPTARADVALSSVQKPLSLATTPPDLRPSDVRFSGNEVTDARELPSARTPLQTDPMRRESAEKKKHFITMGKKKKDRPPLTQVQ
jgi:hypothetical protein